MQIHRPVVNFEEVPTILNRRKFKVQIIYENVKQAQHNQLFNIS